jgi:hypothetical protein
VQDDVDVDLGRVRVVAASKPDVRCDASQNGFVRDRPQRHSATGRSAGTSKRLPSASTMSTGPVTL